MFDTKGLNILIIQSLKSAEQKNIIKMAYRFIFVGLYLVNTGI